MMHNAMTFLVLVAEIVAHFLPKMVELHNYASASSQAQKLTNWDTLNSECYNNFEQSWNSSLDITLDGGILLTGFTR